MEKPDITKMEQWETSGKQEKKPTKSKKSKEPEPLTEEQLEKLPKLPKDWKWVSHSEIAIINPPKPTGDESLEISFLPMPAVEEETGRYSLSETRKLGEVRKGYTGFIEGDVIFAKITPCMENGKVALLEKLVNGIGFGSTEFHVSRPTSSVSGKYLFHYLVQQMFRKEAKRSMTGSAGQLRVSTNYFAEQPFPLAPIPEQRAIVSKIELLFSELDNGIANLKLAQEQLKVYRQAVLDKTTNTEKFVPINNIIDELGQGWSPKCHNEPSINNEEWGVIKTTAIQAGYFNESENKKLPADLEPRVKHELKAGDILITRAGPRVRVGVCCLVKKVRPRLINCDKAYRIRLKENLILPQFFEYTLNSPRYTRKMEDLKTGISDSGVNLTQNRFLDLEIPLPPLLEQQAIVQEIETRLSVCDKIEQDIKENLEKAEALRQSILKKAFEGKLLNERELAEVRGAEDWEPAEVLLERIRAERAENGKK
ncbi:type I restriction endonuclease subunit S [Methanosarcina sp. DH2]|uniref:restriction endonuclease subunit S n=1 Tax=Methanosarcina sp. DH2 TaxID=2605639 RepID=UPI001E4B17AA|nr:restriction endonuclease subunit S [Methanosarcina sp. DH2]MCC4770862.1 type I restriction endonuclease subunit S [Methanosarcina sp. DH2]